MLERLEIRDFSLLRQVELELGPGLTVLTGESGAGKTLILDAVAFALGGRSHRSLLAEGALACSVALTLRLDAALAARLGPPWHEGANRLQRKLSAGGRSSFQLNGAALAQAQLAAAAQSLIEITGQFESRVLFNPQEHTPLLDSFGEAKLQAAKERYQQAYQSWREHCSRLQALRAGAANREQELDFLAFQIAELERAQVGPDERGEVESALAVQQHAQALLLAATSAAGLLGGADDTPGAYDLAARAAEHVAGMAQLVGGGMSALGDVESLDAGLRETLEVLRDLAGQCAQLAQAIAHDPAEETRLRERLDELLRLERKYGVLASELPALLAELQSRLDVLADTAASPEALERAIVQDQARLAELGGELTQLRHKAAKRMAAGALSYFRRLDFPHVELHVELESAAEPGPQGLESAELFVSLNPGEPARPLAQVASGGEASRLLLGLKAALARQLGFQTLMLDEIEAGLGGDTAAHVAAVLEELAGERQVLAITHLPVVAARGRTHLVARKAVEKGRTAVHLAAVAGEARLAELGRMTGGSGSAEERALAAQLLKSAAGETAAARTKGR